ncbi:MAG: protein translocase subunit SecD [bacterium]
MKVQNVWLTTILVLTVVAFLAVFQPVTTTARKDPSDSTKYLRPNGVTDFNPLVQPKPSMTLGATNGVSLYVYNPQSDLRLGLDLRGGMRVVVEMPNKAEFIFPLTTTYPRADKKLMNTENSDKKAALTTEINKSNANALGDNSEIFLNYSLDATKTSYSVNVDITTYPRTQEEAKRQYDLIKQAMLTVFTKDKFSNPVGAEEMKYYKQVDKNLQDETRVTLEKRINPDGTKEITSYNQGTNQVVLEIPGERDPEHVQKLLGETANMSFYILNEAVMVNSAPNPDGGAEKVTITRSGMAITDAQALEDAIPVLRGTDIRQNSCLIMPDQDSPNSYAVTYQVKDEAIPEFADITDMYSEKTLGKGRLMAIVLNNEIKSAPVIKERLGKDVRITGHFTKNEALDLKILLNAGSLKIPVKIVENRTVSATLGEDSVNMSLLAGMVGFIAVLIFMISYYKLPGLMASFALIIYVFLSLLVMKMFPAFTLTLPGIAGIIISIGMAVDANVIIFERLKEELRSGKPVEQAIEVAFARAWTAILDSNVASIITGTVLYALGTGAIRGFAVTLLIGVIVSLFTAVSVTRLFMRMLTHSKAGHNLKAYGL